MNESKISRRHFIAATGAAAAVLPLVSPAPSIGAPAILKSGKFPFRAVSSWNGIKAVETAVELMTKGEDTLDAAIAGVNIVENDPDDISVGYGGLPNENGVVELDAAVMHGPTHRAGSVASLQNIKNPSKVAKLVMDQTDHVILVGDGALQFAKAQGFPEENLLTERSRKIWLYRKQVLSTHDDWLPPSDEDADPEAKAFSKRITGTIHLGAMNDKGEMSCVTTTSGLFFKLPGRVGDSPIIGAGLYVDNEFGTTGSTGRGEANLQNLCSFLGVELMRQGMAPLDAGMEILNRVVKHTSEKHLLHEDGRPNFNLQFYLMNKNGEYAGVGMYGPGEFSVADENGARHEKLEYLYEW